MSFIVKKDEKGFFMLSAIAPILSFTHASELLGFCSVAAARQALYRGTFPVPVHRRPGGRTIVILTRDVEQYAETGVPVSHSGTGPIAQQQKPRRRAGRPTKAEEQAAHAAGLSISDYRIANSRVAKS